MEAVTDGLRFYPSAMHELGIEDRREDVVRLTGFRGFSRSSLPFCQLNFGKRLGFLGLKQR